MSELTLLKSIKEAFIAIQQFEPGANCPIEYETLPAVSENTSSEVIAVFNGNFTSLIRRLEASNGTIYSIDSVVNGKTKKIEFANYTSIVKAQKVAAVVAAFGPTYRLVDRG